MESAPLPTEFAPAERTSEEELKRQAQGLSELPLLSQFLDAVPDMVVVLNKERQIVFANRSLYDFLATDNGDSVRGLRPGEALNCAHSAETEGGCGTTRFCRVCGVANGILSCQGGEPDVQECRIARKPDGEALDLRVWTRPVELGTEEFTLFAVADIADEKRRRALERIFFHDILNTAGGLRGFVELLGEVEPQEVDELQEVLNRLTGRLIDEINAQKELAAAENDDLVAQPTPISAAEFLREMAESYENHEVAKDRYLEVTAGPDVVFTSDRPLLGRVIGNMVKNALEASGASQTVTLGSEVRGEEIEFAVHNPTFMPPDAQLQVFQRSFSTKGAGRGLGTYSMKLLSERYLGGSVSFTTSPQSGTTYRARYPLALTRAETRSR